MKFAHLADCHLGGWRYPELRELNFESFRRAIDKCIKEKTEFVLIAGDLFDSAYPSINTLKDTFGEFKKLKDENIPVFLIAGSHDYSASGKTFLEVLEKSGFCKNVEKYSERDGRIILEPTIYKNVAVYGFPGRKSGLEVEDIKKIKLQDSPGLFKILMLHTAIRDAVINPMIKSVDERELPKVDYLALGHLHIRYIKDGRVYPGPIFPNNLSELEELRSGSFCIFDNGQIERQDIPTKEIVSVHLELNNSLAATEAILSILKEREVNDKIIIVRVFGLLEQGKISDIDFRKIETSLKERGAFVFLKSTSKLHMSEPEIKIDSFDSENLEVEIIDNFRDSSEKFSHLINPLINSLKIEKLEDETSSSFEERLVSESKKILSIR
ncbi:DNA repair exonuclease [Candidatus Pacearchaeota archaeon]|nr:DNA repair exonuclease [Candidatus Pacearchaeota archaeon]